MNKRPLRGAPRARQHGIALVVMLAIIMLSASWLLVSRLNASTADVIAAKRARNALVLSQAKQALIGWIAMQATKAGEPDPGRLPCPEPASDVGTDTEGGTTGFCSASPSIGRFPWRTVGMDKPVDVAGEPLWFVVSAGWKKANANALTINSNSLGQLKVDGVDNAAVALIIAPGPALNAQAATGCVARNQARSAPSSSINPLDYLECYDAATASFSTIGSSTSINDQVMLVTVADVMPALEAAVATRIQREVLPHLQTAIYNTSQWGASVSSAAPIFPFPARFRNNTGTFNPESFQGRQYSDDANTVALTQGLLPVTAYTCNTLTTGRCDPNFVQWSTAGITVTKTSGTPNITSYSCAASTTSQVQCTVNYSATCANFCIATMGISLVASAQKLGMAMRTIVTTGITGVTSPTIPTATIGADGSASTDVRGTTAAIICFNFGGNCTASGSATVTVPITIFPDHAFLNPTSADEWYWFFQNKWHELTYYAVAPRHTPSGSPHNCTTVTANCITINAADGTVLGNRQAVLVLAGRSLSGTARPNGTLADFLDGTENTNGDTTFAQSRPGRTFNDRFVTLGNY